MKLLTSSKNEKIMKEKFIKVGEGSLVIFKFNNIEIPFSLNGGPDNLMINVTPIAKAYGKKVAEWKRLPSTQNYLRGLYDMGFSHTTDFSDIIYSISGSKPGMNLGGGGTWMHQLVVVEFARWLDAEFAVWCNQAIINVIKEGYVAHINELNSQINQLVTDLDNMTNRANNLQQKIQSYIPKVNYFDQVLQNPEPLYSTNQIVKQLGIRISNQKLLKMMENDGLIYRDTRTNKYYVTAEYNKYRYRISTTMKDKKTGEIRTIDRWTEAGKQWIYSIALGYKII